MRRERALVASKSVLLAMSGGVDSSVAAILLKEAGFRVVGVTMRLLDDEGDVDDARECACAIGIEHQVEDMRHRFAERVIAPFCQSYLCGETPNPCILCNRRIKFGALASMREKMGLDYLATGHYARRCFDEGIRRFVIRQGRDPKKDQSYVLAFLEQGDLARTLFPLGDMAKDEVRRIAAEHGLPISEKPESQDICFVSDGAYGEFIEDRTGQSPQPGPIFDESGELLGRHSGLIRYTIGQRKGLGIAAPHPLYVIEKDMRANALLVGCKDSLLKREVFAKDASLVSLGLDDVAGKPLRGWAKTHYRHKGAECRAVFEEDGTLSVTFEEPQVKAAAGQTLVFYQGDVVVGAGIIMDGPRWNQKESTRRGGK